MALIVVPGADRNNPAVVASRESTSDQLSRALKSIDECQVQYASMRYKFHVYDRREPRDLVEPFAKLNHGIRNTCTDIAEDIADHFSPDGSRTSLFVDGKIPPQFAPPTWLVKSSDG